MAPGCRIIVRFTVVVLFGFSLQALVLSQGLESLEAPPPAEFIRLENGIRIIYLPATGSEAEDPFVEVVVGYAAGLRDEGAYAEGVFPLGDTYLAVSIATRSLALAAHFAGGQVDFFQELDSVGMRLRVPHVAIEHVLQATSAYFAQELDVDTLEYARSIVSERARVEDDFRVEIDDDIRQTLFGNHPYRRRRWGSSSEITRVTLEEFELYYKNVLGTDRAFLIVSQPLSETVRNALSAIKARPSRYANISSRSREVGLSVLEFPAQQVGGVILATATASVHFQEWFSTLVLDGLIRKVVPAHAEVEFGPALDPFFHQVKLRVEIPSYAEDERDRLLEDIDELQYRTVSHELLREIKDQAERFLANRKTLEWFAAHDLWATLEEGWTAVEGMTADEVRTAARDMVSGRRVVATWAPAFAEPSFEVESLGQHLETPELTGGLIQRAPGSVEVLPLDETKVPNSDPVRVEKLDSGITLAVAEEHALFVSGPFQENLPGGVSQFGSNGVFWSFEEAPTEEVLEALRAVRADRILIFVPASDIASERRNFENWESGQTDFTASTPAGRVATGDIPSLLTLKMWLDGKLIEAGWWEQVKLRFNGIEGSRLLIETDPQREAHILGWIRQVARHGLPDNEFIAARRAAVGYHDRIRQDLQILLWQRDPRGSIRSPAHVSKSRLKTVARIYF